MSEPESRWPIPWKPVIGDRGGPQAWLEAQGVRLVINILGAMPEPLKGWFIETAARVSRRVDARHSDAARRFLQQAFGPGMGKTELERRVLDAWRYFFRLLVGTTRLDREVARRGSEACFEIEYAPGIREAFERPRRGLIVITPHLGDFEAGAFVLARTMRSPLYAVARPPRNRYLSIEVQRRREQRGYRVLHRHGAMEDAARIFAANGTLVLLLDQRARRRTVVAPFFGRLAHCERGAAVLMRRMSVPVVLGWCEALENPVRWRLHWTHWFDPEQFARRSPQEIATTLNRAMEQLILSAPEQYFWLHDRYRKGPDAPATPGDPQRSPEADEDDD